MSIRARFVLLALLAFSVMAHAQGLGEQTRAFTGTTLRLQDKADTLYRDGHWERAYFIYVNELAAVGDKYAQYMAGYMSLTGRGVPRDAIRASAWYRLAAERNGREFVEVRDKLLESMSEADRLASDAAFIALRKEYGDLVLALAVLEKDREQYNESPTGSRLSGNTSPVTVMDPRTGITITRTEYLERVEKRMEIRLNFIAARLDIKPPDVDMSDRAFGELKVQVADYLNVIDDRQQQDPR